MAKIRILADKDIPYLQGVFEPFADIVYQKGSEINTHSVKNFDALLTRTRTRCNEALLNNSKIKFAATATAGTDHFDIPYLQQASISWAGAPGCNSVSVCQYVTAVLLQILHRWRLKASEHCFGIIGAGHVGSKVAAAAEALGFNVLICDPPRARIEGENGFVTLKTIQKECSLITFHVPLQTQGEDSTFHLANTDFFQNVRHRTFLINTSRGEVIDSAALIQALNIKKVEAAFLDVWENEPILDIHLMNRCALATPHIAGYSADGKADATRQAVQACANFFDLPLKKWQPPRLTGGKEIIIPSVSGSVLDKIFSAVHTAYDPRFDDSALRKNPDSFEFLRSSYPFRRENSAFTVKFENIDTEAAETLSKLGFKVY